MKLTFIAVLTGLLGTNVHKPQKTLPEQNGREREQECASTAPGLWAVRIAAAVAAPEVTPLIVFGKQREAK
jgi:hypothetical protein